ELAFEHADLARELQHRLRDAEVEQLDLAVVTDPDVRGGYVPIDDVERPALDVIARVRIVQAIEHPGGDVAGMRHRDTLAGLLTAPKHLGQILAADVFHRDKVAPLDLANLEGANDGVVVEDHGQLALADEHFDEARLARERRAHALDGEQLVADRAALGAGPIDFGHAAPGNHPEEQILPERGRMVGGAAGK